MKPQSLIRRTMLIVLSAELLCAIAFSGSALWHERRTRLRAFDETLQGRSDSILGAVQDAEDPEDNVTIDPIELKVPSSDVYAVYNLGSRLLGASSTAPDALITRHKTGFSNREWNGHGYRVFERNAMRVIDRADNGGDGLQRPITIVYAAPTARIWHEIFEAAGFYALISLALLALTAALLVALLRKALHPIEELATRAGSVSRDALYFDAPPSALRTRELAPLAQVLSETIASLRNAFENEQRFVSDAAHELKTAVAVVRSTIQVLAMRSRSQEEYTTGLDKLLDDNQRVEDLISRMLTLARVEQASAQSATTDLSAVAAQTLSNLASFAEARSITLTLQSQPNTFAPLSPEQAEVLISNLLVNAMQHSTAGSSVSVTVTQDAAKTILRVRDTGSGIAADALPHIFERFYREDTSRSRDTGGAGLGLAICKSIVQSAGGTIALASTPGVETIATVVFRLS